MLVYVCLCRPEMVKGFSPNNSLNRQLSFKVEVLNHMGWYLGHKVFFGSPTPSPQFFFAFLRIFQKEIVFVREKNKVSFYKVYA